ncbi:hypothetical protein [Burkholderia cenocepacia]|uniref:hypothetical protein n=1 Tax=Burkholderia cenocepacia TaxID=95486 RepID=UPI00111559A2|nr:hypothetical protein [Burkholderia cenocepacia]
MSGFLETLGGLHVLEKLGNQGREIDSLNLELDGNHQQLDHARRDLAAASGSLAYYRRVNKELTEKTQLLQEVNDDLRVTLADWTVSQRAFREIAMKYGALAGKTPQEVIEEGLAAEEVVLKNEAKMSASNNVDTCSRAKPYKDRLLAKLQKAKQQG